MKLLLKFLGLSVVLSSVLGLIGQALGPGYGSTILYALGVSVAALILGQRKFETDMTLKWLAIGCLIPCIYLYLPAVVSQKLEISLNWFMFQAVIFRNELLLVALVFVSAFLEEIGWREFLYNKLKKYGWVKMNLSVGVAWSIWHWPAIFTGAYYLGANMFAGVLVFTINLVLLSFIFSWLRQKSGTVVIAAIAHGLHNLIYRFNNHESLFTEYSLMLTLSLLVLVLVISYKKLRAFYV